MSDRLLQIREVCQRIGVARTYIYDALRNPESKFPRPIKTQPANIGKRAGRNLWSEREVSMYIDQRLDQRAQCSTGKKDACRPIPRKPGRTQ